MRWNPKKKPFPSLDALLIDVDAPRRAKSPDEQWQRMLSIAASRKSVN